MPPRGSGQCWSTVLRDRVQELRASGDPERLERLDGYLLALESSREPRSTLKWIKRCPGFAILEQLARGELPLTHEALDELESTRTNAVTFLRPALVTHGALPARDEHLARLRRWITIQLGELPESEDRGHLRAFAHWRVLRDVEGRYADTNVSPGGTHHARRQVRRAIELIDWLHRRDLRLTDLRQDLFDEFICESASMSNGIQGFVRFLQTNEITTPLETPTRAARDHTRPLANDTRQQLIGRLLADETLDPRDRLAGFLLLLYAQPPARITQLRIEDLHIEGSQVRLRMGNATTLLPEPLDRLARQLVTQRHAQALSAVIAPSPWLFAGSRIEQPMHHEHLARRLRRLGITVEPGRVGALEALLHRTPATVVASRLGYSPWIAQKWSRHSAAYYARYIAQRTPTT
jgi:hypothetical protein